MPLAKLRIPELLDAAKAMHADGDLTGAEQMLHAALKQVRQDNLDQQCDRPDGVLIGSGVARMLEVSEAVCS